MTDNTQIKQIELQEQSNSKTDFILESTESGNS